MAAKRTPPWKKKTPKGTAKTPLTPAQKTWAMASAKKAGRPYPNLIDNMNATKQKG